MARPTQALKLSASALRALTTLLRSGSTAARTHTRARVLALLQRGHHPDDIAATLSLSTATVFHIKRHYREEGLDAALFDKPRSGRPPELLGTQRAQITARACSKAPQGHARWTLRLLADKAVELGFVASLSHTGVGAILKKTT
jgi:putative transposase